jgi:GNAT superfamily N-acetyltransferase
MAGVFRRSACRNPQGLSCAGAQLGDADALVVPAAYETGYVKAGVCVQDVFVALEARQRGVGRALMAAVAADACRRGLEFVSCASPTWNTESYAFFRTLATVEEPVIAFATFGDQFTKLADEGD